MIRRSIKYINPLNQEFDFSKNGIGIIDVKGLYAPKFQSNLQKSPGVAGRKYISSNIDQREISIEAGIVSQFNMQNIFDKKREIVNIFNAELNDLYGLGTLIYSDETITRTLQVFVDQIEINTTKMKDGGQPFSITFVAGDPYWNCDSPTTEIIETVVNLFSVVSGGSHGFLSGGMALSASLVGSPVTVLNSGDTKSYPVFTFYGPATNPKIENQTTGEYILIDKVLLSTDIMVIDCYNKTVLINGTVNGNQYLNVASTFWGLDVGLNDVRFTSTDTSVSARCAFTYCDRFLGV